MFPVPIFEAIPLATADETSFFKVVPPALIEVIIELPVEEPIFFLTGVLSPFERPLPGPGNKGIPGTFKDPPDLVDDIRDPPTEVLEVFEVVVAPPAFLLFNVKGLTFPRYIQSNDLILP